MNLIQLQIVRDIIKDKNSIREKGHYSDYSEISKHGKEENEADFYILSGTHFSS
jgi:hypothetical protein